MSNDPLDSVLPNDRERAIGLRAIAEARRRLREGKPPAPREVKPIDPSEPREREEP